MKSTIRMPSGGAKPNGSRPSATFKSGDDFWTVQEVLNSLMTKPAGSKEDFEWPLGLAINGDCSLIYVGFTLTGRRVHRYRRNVN